MRRKDLWTKFDRYGFMRPTVFNLEEATIEKPEWKTQSNWCHWYAVFMIENILQ